MLIGPPPDARRTVSGTLRATGGDRRSRHAVRARPRRPTSATRPSWCSTRPDTVSYASSDGSATPVTSSISSSRMRPGTRHVAVEPLDRLSSTRSSSSWISPTSSSARSSSEIDAGEPAELVDHAGELAAFGAQPFQHGGQRQRRRHHQRGRGDLADRRRRPLFGRQRQHLGQADDAAQVVQVVADHGETRVPGVQQLHHARGGLVEPHGVHVHARRHRLLGRPARGSPSPRSSSRVSSGSRWPCSPASLDDLLEVLRRRALRQLLDRLDADRAQQPVRRRVEQPDHRPGDLQVDQRRRAQPLGELLRACAMARFFGSSSPSTICTTVANTSATAIDSGTRDGPGQPEQATSPVPSSGSAT